MIRITLRRFAVALSSAAMASCAPIVTATVTAAPTDPAQVAACDFGRQYTTFDFNNYDDYDHRITDRATGAFRDQFLGSAADRRNRTVSSHTVTEAKTVECRTETGDAEHAEIIVTVDQSTRSDATLGLPQPIRSNLRVHLDNVDGHWLASRVDTL